MTHYEKVVPCIKAQTDPYFHYQLRRYGCRVMSVLGIPQFVAGKCLDHDQIMRLVDRGRNTPDVIVDGNPDDNLDIKMSTGGQEHMLIGWAFDELGMPDRGGAQVGAMDEHGEVTYWRWYKERRWSYMIVQWETGGPDGHFTLYDRRQKEIYDPFNPAQADYEIDKKRIVRRLLYDTWEGV